MKDEQGNIIPNDLIIPLIEGERLFSLVVLASLIKLKVWERGSGSTKACGTGESATTVAAIKNKLINKRICHIHMEGGKLKIEYKKNGHIVMTGPIKTIKKGVLNNYF